MSHTGTQREGWMVRIAVGFTAWAEKWFPDAFIFVAIAVVVVAAAALANGASPPAVSEAFGGGFWSLITFTMQMAFVAIGGYVVATSPPASRLIHAIARLPKSGPGAVGTVAAVSILASLINWGLSLIFGGLLVRALAERSELKMDYRAAAAAAYLGLGATWAMGLSSSAAQLQANPASLPKALLPITGVIPFSETIFLWQSMVVTVVLLVVSVLIAFWSAPGRDTAVTAESMVTSAVVALAITAVLAWVIVKGHLPYIWKEWLSSVDHKRIGVMYIVLALVMLLRGFADAILMRSQQAVALGGAGFLPPEHYNQIFSAHGTIMRSIRIICASTRRVSAPSPSGCGNAGSGPPTATSASMHRVTSSALP